jgi:predicted PurR-regulated permease PerM
MDILIFVAAIILAAVSFFVIKFLEEEAAKVMMILVIIGILVAGFFYMKSDGGNGLVGNVVSVGESVSLWASGIFSNIKDFSGYAVQHNVTTNQTDNKTNSGNG